MFLVTPEVLETRRSQLNSQMAVLTNNITVLLVFISVVLAVSDLDAPETIYSLDAYGHQLICARQCFYSGAGGWYDSIGETLSCDIPMNSGSPNWCFCRADKQSVAVTYLSNCVNSKCGKNTADTNMATSLYLAYCTPKISPAKQDAVSTTTPATAGPVQTSSVTSGSGAVQTVYVTRGSSNRLTINFSLALFLVKPILAPVVVCFRGLPLTCRSLN